MEASLLRSATEDLAPTQDAAAIEDRAADREASRRMRGLAARPSVWLLAALVPCAALLTLPMAVALGAFYWDLYVYFDGGHRVLLGQIPSVDFFAPVGPLSYWLVAAFMKAFPHAQPLLLVEWCLLPISLPTMAAVLADVERRSPRTAWLLAIPFVVLQVLPINFEQFTIYLSFDGFGNYNRHTSGLLFILVSALLFVTDRRLLTGLVAVLCTALFLLKITGFAVALALCALAWLAGRLSWREVWRSALVFAFVLAVLELWTGVVSAYLRDILVLLHLNSETLLSRWVRAASTHAGALGAFSALAGALAWVTRRRLGQDLALLFERRDASAIARLAGLDLTWLVATIVTGWFLETQNTGGHAFVFCWPVLIRIAASGAARHAVIAILMGAAVLPPLVGTLGRGARAVLATATQPRLDDPALKSLGQVSYRPDDARNADLRLSAYGRSNTTQELFLKDGGIDNVDQTASPEFQVLWLKAAAQAVRAVRRLEETTGTRFGSVLNVGYVNPFPYLLDRDAPRLVAIGADPTRTTPHPDAATLASIAATDLLLASNCPSTSPDDKLAQLYAPVLQARTPIRLSPCWTAYPKAPLGETER